METIESVPILFLTEHLINEAVRSFSLDEKYLPGFFGASIIVANGKNERILYHASDSRDLSSLTMDAFAISAHDIKPLPSDIVLVEQPKGRSKGKGKYRKSWEK